MDKSKKRFLKTLELGMPDRVPIFEINIDEVNIVNIAQIISDKDIEINPESEGYERREEILDLYCYIIKELDLDAATSYFSIGMKKIDEKYGSDKFGIKYRYSDHGEPIAVEGPIKTKEDIKKYSMASRITEEDANVAKYVINKLGHSKAQIINVLDPFKVSWFLRGGMDKLLIDYMTDPGLVKDLAKIAVEYSMASVELASKLQADGIILVGDLAGEENTFTSPEQFREFIQPYEKEVVDFAHKKGLKVIKHSDGNLWPIMDDLVDVGFDGYHPIQPQCMDIGEFKVRYDRKICIV
jgi:uroporphyrinogen decarboxylase